MPTPRGALTVQVLGGIIYAVGGEGESGVLNINEAYDPETNTWERKASMLTPREHLASAVAFGKLYVIGGRQGFPGTSNLNNNEEYDPDSDTWITKPPMPSNRGGIAGASVNGRIYIFGGEALTMVFDSSEEYDVRDEIWMVREPMRVARHGLGAATVGNRIFIIGGGEAQHLFTLITNSRANEILTIPLEDL